MNNTTAEIDNSSVGVVIVNYRTAKLCCRAIDSLHAERQFLPELRCVVVDNDSQDGSLEQLQQHVKDKAYASWVDVLDAGKNGGYAFGNNLGLAHLNSGALPTPDFYWLLNPDTCLHARAGWHLLNFIKHRLAQHNESCIVGSRLEDEDGTPQVSTFNFPTWRSETLAGFGLGILDKAFRRYRVIRDLVDEPEQVDWVAGASLMIPQDIFRSVGPMDDNYFLYFEEVDYCLNIQRAGFPCWYVPASRVVHEVGASTGISDVRKQQPRRPQYWFNSRRRYFSKNFGVAHLLLADIGWMLGYSSWCLRKFFSDKKDFYNQPPKLLSDTLRNSVLNVFR